MRRFVIIFIGLFLSISSYGQLRVLEVVNQADTLIFTSTHNLTLEECIELYKGPKGYILKSSSDRYAFYLGEDKENAMRILKDLSKLCELDVATTMLIQDEEENVFFGKVACLANMTRKPTFIKGDRLFITKDDFTRYMCLKQNNLDQIVKFLKQR